MESEIIEDKEVVEHIRNYAERHGIKISSLVIGLNFSNMKYVFHCEADFPSDEVHHEYLKFVASYLGCKESDLSNRNTKFNYIS